MIVIFFWILMLGGSTMSGFSTKNGVNILPTQPASEDQSTKGVKKVLKLKTMNSLTPEKRLPGVSFSTKQSISKPLSDKHSGSKRLTFPRDDFTIIFNLMQIVMNYEKKVENFQKTQDYSDTILKEVEKATGVQLKNAAYPVHALTEIKRIIQNNQDEILTVLEKSASKSPVKQVTFSQLQSPKNLQALEHKIKEHKLYFTPQLPQNFTTKSSGDLEMIAQDLELKNEMHGLGEEMKRVERTALITEIQNVTGVKFSILTPEQQMLALEFLKNTLNKKGFLTIEDFNLSLKRSYESFHSKAAKVFELMKIVMNSQKRQLDPVTVLREIEKKTKFKLNFSNLPKILGEIKRIIQSNQEEILTALQKISLKSALKKGPLRKFKGPENLLDSHNLQELAHKIKEYKFYFTPQLPSYVSTNSSENFKVTAQDLELKKAMYHLGEEAKRAELTELMTDIQNVTGVKLKNLVLEQQIEALKFLKKRMNDNDALVFNDFSDSLEYAQGHFNLKEDLIHFQDGKNPFAIEAPKDSPLNQPVTPVNFLEKKINANPKPNPEKPVSYLILLNRLEKKIRAFLEQHQLEISQKNQ